MSGAGTGGINEGLVTFQRILELRERPIAGRFDLDHLKQLHATIFQDLPHRQPGEVRGDTEGWSKVRQLEGRSSFYAVHYVHEGVAQRLDTVLRELGGPAGLVGLDPAGFARRMGALYGDLDHAHGFHEGNSRTLREFTRSLAATAGYTLDWAGTGVDAAARNRLYLARDVAVLDRVYPGLTEERAMKTTSRSEYEAWFTLDSVRRAQTGTIEQIISESTSRLAQPGQRVLDALRSPPSGETVPDRPLTPMAGRLQAWRDAEASEKAVTAKPSEPEKPAAQAGLRSRSSNEPGF